jgi:hypothetical protein
MRKIRVQEMHPDTSSFVERTRDKQQKFVTTGINYNDLESLS